jgi:hypothetical protein
MTTQPLPSASGETPTNRSGGIDLTSQDAHVQGDVTGRDKIVSIQGNVIYLQNPSAEVVAELLRVGAMSTEVTRPTSPAASVQSSPSTPTGAVDSSALQSIDETLKLFQQQGTAVNELRAGGVSISRIDLLLKKAILLQAEADELLMDAAKQSQSATPQPVDETAIQAKWQQAYQLLQEANRLDPTDTEVLLHIAQLLTQLTPGDPGDEQKILYRIHKLLGNPKTDTARFQLAQASFLLATSSEPIQLELVRNARTMFEQLGRADWVQHCDGLLNAPSWQSPPTGFQPVGRWQIRVTDMAGSVIFIDLYPNGACQGWQQAANFGMNIPFAGQWAFVPYNQMLQLQGLANGMYPFALGVMIQGQQANGYYGVGTDGNGYFLARA